MSETATARFWAKVEKTETCWLWRGAATRQGYGSFMIAKKQTDLAHRFSYRLHFGAIPEGEKVHQTCGNRACIKPAHLVTLTASEVSMRRVCKPRHLWAPITPKPPEDRFWPKVRKSDGCWEWTSKRYPNGYGCFFIAGKRSVGAHRFSYELAKGPIPKGLVIDHLCRNKACVNPAHLEAVTNSTNILRGERQTRQSHCRRGHEWTPENTRLGKDGRRMCLACYRRHIAAITAKRRAIAERMGRDAA